MEKGLICSSSDESFEHIDPEFDDSYYPELRGVAACDYSPKNDEEISVRKGQSY